MTGQQISAFLPLVLVFVFMYFFMIRPQNKQQKKIQEMRNNLKKGDRIVTVGGFHGKVVGFKENIVVIELKPDNVKVEITKVAVAEVVREAEADPKKSDKDE